MEHIVEWHAVPSILVLPAGSFGSVVARQLKKLRPSVEVLADAAEGGLRGLTPGPGSIVIFASQHPMHVVADILDASASQSNHGLLPLTLEDGAMWLGPVVAPGSSSCLRCWSARDSPARASSYITAQRNAYYEENPAVGPPAGFLPSLAALGASQCASILERFEHFAGEVVRTDFGTLTASTIHAIGFDNCDRCGLRRPLSTRSSNAMHQALEFLWD